MEVVDDISSYKVLTSEDGSPLLTQNNIVIQHVEDETIAYIENSQENRKLLGLTNSNTEQSIALKLVDDWQESNTKQLLILYLKYLDEFRNPKCKKKDVWKKISQQIGIEVSACDRKFRNLKHHYIQIVKKTRRHGNIRQPRWAYFKLLDQIFQNDLEMAQYFQDNIRVMESSEQLSRKRFLKPNEVKTRKRLNNTETTRNLKKTHDEICSKLNKLIEKITESNEIQRTRNELFAKYIEKL